MNDVVWNGALSLQAQTLSNVRDLKVDLPANPVKEKNIGGLNGKVSQVRSFMNTVRDYILESQVYLIALRNEAHEAEDDYEDRLAAELQRLTTLPEEDRKRLPKAVEEREILFRRSCPVEWNAKRTTTRRVEEWELYQKILYTIYYSLRDTNNDIAAQVAIIKQQYFSGEVEVSKTAAGIFDFLSDETKKLFATQESGLSGPVEVDPDSMEVVL